MLPRSRSPLLLAFACLLALCCAAPARAGTYDVYSCWAGADSFRNPSANATAWAKTTPNGDRFNPFDQCGSGSGNGFGVISVSGYDAPSGSYGDVSFTAAPGTAVTRLRLYRTAWTYGTGGGGDSHRNSLGLVGDGQHLVMGDDFDGTADVPHGGAGTDDRAEHGIIPANLMDADLSAATPTTIAYRVACGFSSCPTAAPDGSFAAGVNIFGSIVTVRDTSEPALTVAPGGLLAAGKHSGTESVHVSAAKDNSGIKRLAVFAEGASSPVGVVDFERNADKCQWWLAHPCQDVTDVDIPVDTRRVGDGDHRFLVRAYDAAENMHQFTSDLVTVKNTADAKSDSLGPAVPARGAPNGAGASDAARLVAVFTRGRHARLRNRFGRAAGIRGQLTDEAGHPIAGAQVSLTSRLTATSPEQPISVATAGPDGSFKFIVPARGPSRRLFVTYRSHIGDPAPAATSELALRISAAVRLGVRPRHVHNGQSIRFTGSLLGGPVPSAGKLVEMQVRVGRTWKTFATVRARGHGGHFSYRYRFARTYERITYRFRALSRVEDAYPYATGASRVVKVRVN